MKLTRYQRRVLDALTSLGGEADDVAIMQKMGVLYRSRGFHRSAAILEERGLLAHSLVRQGDRCTYQFRIAEVEPEHIGSIVPRVMSDIVARQRGGAA